MTLLELPHELLEMIHYQVLNSLDITAVLEDPLPEDKQDCNLCETFAFHVLDPATLSLIDFYNQLFAPTSSRKPIWEEHVRFVFPSFMAMADVFYSLQEAGKLKQIRKVKVFHRDGFICVFLGFCFIKSNIWMYDILREYETLQLNHFECETQTSLYGYTSHDYEAEIGDWLSYLLRSSGWKCLSILSTGSDLPSEFVDGIIETMEKTRSRDPDDTYVFDLPGTPLLRNGDNIVGSLYAHLTPPLPPRCSISALQVARPSWLGGASVEPVIMVERAGYGVCAQAPRLSGTGVPSMWYAAGRSRWKEFRKLSNIPNGMARFGTAERTKMHTCERNRPRRDDSKPACPISGHTSTCPCLRK